MFLYKIKNGPSMKSFGIEVARKAGMPQVIIDLARNISNSFTKIPKIETAAVHTNW